MDPAEKVRRAEGRRNSQIGRRQSLTSSHVEQMKETLKERAAKYKELIYIIDTLEKPDQMGVSDWIVEGDPLQSLKA